MPLLTASDLRRIFLHLDKNRDGFVIIDDLNRLLRSTGVVLESGDLESEIGKSRLDFTEFSSLYRSISEQNGGDCGAAMEDEEVQSDLWSAFQVFDENRDGFISCDELRNVLVRMEMWEENNGGGNCSLMIRAFDIDLDGKLDFQEFKNMMLFSPSSS